MVRQQELKKKSVRSCHIFLVSEDSHQDEELPISRGTSLQGVEKARIEHSRNQNWPSNVTPRRKYSQENSA